MPIINFNSKNTINNYKIKDTINVNIILECTLCMFLIHNLLIFYHF